MSQEGHRGMRPPKGLLFALLTQAPLLLWAWPPTPAAAEVVAGAACFLAGAFLNLSAERLFRRAAVGVCPFSPVARLVDAGPYRFTRNPMYLGMVLIAAAPALATGVPAGLAAPLALGLWLHFRFVLREEAFLESTLGVEYLRYASRVSRWLGLPVSAVDSRPLRA